VEEEVLEVRELICLSTHQAVVLKDEQGSHHIRFGDAKKGTERAFFLPPHWELVTLMWSRGRRREKRDLAIRVFDTRPQYMSFEFNCRTSDNVEMVLEGTFFWEVVDIQAMLEYTGDAPGDVCSHARSCFIQLISKVTLQQFMNEFNAIAKQAHTSDDLFYSQRGLKIHSLEVTRYACADHSTSAILEQIIAETTNRMNRLSCQESENEVCLARLQGEEEQENAKSAVLAIKQQHAVESARAEGLAEAERCLSFLRHVRAEDKGKDGLAEELWHALRKAEALKDVSQGNAHVYFTPQDAHLTIENRQ
jgi:regulator of protease activity HflC (stomatin/prohibitin superfamily)